MGCGTGTVSAVNILASRAKSHHAEEPWDSSSVLFLGEKYYKASTLIFFQSFFAAIHKVAIHCGRIQQY